ncbi:MAG: sigma-54-dependent Fis family transcriptional regulator [Spirochaetales bacterium]|nr:sigma-54-dependent Fis family transcriptional regulator [Spirochaetales bacterium]
MISVLFIDDDVQAHKTLRMIMPNTFRLVSAFSAEHGEEILKTEKPDVILLDINLPGKSGLELLKTITLSPVAPPVVMISAEDDVSVVVAAIRNGAFDYVVKPFDYKKLEGTIFCAVENTRLYSNKGSIKDSGALNAIVGESPAIQNVKELVTKCSGSTSSVCITGKSGTGKELVAEALHKLSPRCDGPFIAINCGAIPQNIIESELFGTQRGAFTDAQTRKGSFESAHNGTLFLDEIGEMSLDAQVKLLRVLEEKKVVRIGSSTPIPVNVRVICATNKDLQSMIANREFRQDLYYRISVLPISLPDLKDRPEDIPLLAFYFIDLLSDEVKKLSDDATQKLVSYPWPGNIRELKNVVERALIYANGDFIRASDIVF